MSPSRRTVLTVGAALPIAACAKTPPKTASPQTFILLHGTWHGGWVWRYVRDILTAQGHRVLTPTLTGCGEREHLSAPDIGLETHITDLTHVIDFEDLSDIIFVGHSFSSIAMTGAADRRKDKIKHICFFDAIVPRPGRMSGVPRKPDGTIEQYFIDRQAGFIDGYKMDMWADYPLKMLLPEDHPKADWVRSKITTHPAKAWTDELTLKHGGWADLSRSYIHCVGQDFAMTSNKMVGPGRDAGWNYIPLDIPRDGMVTHPELVAQTLTQLA